MKKAILLITFNLFLTFALAQDYSSLPATEFQSQEDFEQAVGQVLECANYLLDHPLKENELNRLNAFQYIFLWMEGTANHTFSIGKREMDLTKSKTDYMTVYFAAVVKTVLENSEKLTDDEVYKAASLRLANYCSNSENGLKPNKAIKKILKGR